MASAPSSSVSFPALSESPQKYHGKPGSPLKAPHLPFRRISLPTAPSLLDRISVVSVGSFDSLPEDGDEFPQRTRTLAKVPETSVPGRPLSMSVESPRRRKPTRREASARPADERNILKRRKVVEEFYETEKAYVEGLELIYAHFLTPIITSLDSTEPLLNRSALTSIFSNFIDIWNLHRSFLSALASVLGGIPIPTSPSSSQKEDPLPDLSPLLLSHFPYLSLYTPFVTAFPATISALNGFTAPPTPNRPNPQYNQRFAAFLSVQEADSRCGKLKLRDWLLTIVQRCPRYLLLLKDLINSTSREDPEHGQLTAVHTLVSKITLSLNTSLHTHAQTMALLALQRATPNLPFQLISPGRTLLKRGSLIQVERSGTPLEREFLLFSDCLLWLAPAEPLGQSWDWSWTGSAGGGTPTSVSHSSHNTPVGSKLSAGGRPPMTRSRSKSEAELSKLKAETNDENRTPAVDNDREVPSGPVTPMKSSKGKSPSELSPPPPPPSMPKRSYAVDDKWVYKGRVELVDLQVIVGSALEDERKFEILSPEGSFTAYAASKDERDEWASEIRNGKAQLLVSLNIMNPNSTLTSSSSTNHVRRALQALPYPPDDARVGTLRASSSLDVFGSAAQLQHGLFKSSKKDKAKGGISAERRRKVEHWVPAIWIPDGKTASCMRCGRMFGWRRRRHHCRLCGRCVCAGCSGRTFFISDSTDAKQESKPARACDACYESVFPLIDPPNEQAGTNGEGDADQPGADTITSLSHLPSWLSMPALQAQRQPHALMAIDLHSSRDLTIDTENINSVVSGADDRERRARMRVKSHQRLRSYQQIVEDFQQHARENKTGSSNQGQGGQETENTEADEVEDEQPEGEDLDDMDAWYTPTHSLAPSPASSPRKQRREDTARRSKRFSLPALALQTTSVTARTSDVPSEGAAVSRESSVAGDRSSGGIGRPKRFSLVLAGRHSYYSDGSGGKSPVDDIGSSPVESGLGRGIAAARLSELLGRKPKT